MEGDRVAKPAQAQAPRTGTSPKETTATDCQSLCTPWYARGRHTIKHCNPGAHRRHEYVDHADDLVGLLARSCRQRCAGCYTDARAHRPRAHRHCIACHRLRRGSQHARAQRERGHLRQLREAGA